MDAAELAKRKAEWAERKADEASASDAPWWLGNLRVYQNMASKLWSEHYRLERAKNEPATPPAPPPTATR